MMVHSVGRHFVGRPFAQIRAPRAGRPYISSCSVVVYRPEARINREV